MSQEHGECRSCGFNATFLTTSSQWQKEHNDDVEDEDTSEEEKKCRNISAGSAQISLKTNYA